MSRDDSQLGGTQLIMVASPASASLHQVSRVTVILLCTPSLLFTLECTTNSTNSNNVYRYQTCELVCISACKGALHTNGLSYHFSLPVERSICILQGTLKHTYTHCRICTTLYVSKGMSADTWGSSRGKGHVLQSSFSTNRTCTRRRDVKSMSVQKTCFGFIKQQWLDIVLCGRVRRMSCWEDPSQDLPLTATLKMLAVFLLQSYHLSVCLIVIVL